MQNSDSVFRCFSFVESQLRDSQATDAKSLTPFVTISRQTGSGAHHIGHELVDILNHKEDELIPEKSQEKWSLYDRDLVTKVLEQHNLRRTIANYMPEDTVNEFNSTLEEMLGLHPSSNELVRDTAQTIRYLAKKGRCIIIGRGSHVITHRLPHGLHIRLVGSLQNRAKRIAFEKTISITNAIDFIKREDRARARYLNYYYASDINDPTNYDLTINTDSTDTRDAANLIASLLCSRTLQNLQVH